LARATGQRMPADEVDVDEVLAAMKRSLKSEARQPGFGPEVKPPKDAQPIDQLAAFLGRKP
ncbi:MAG TPA: TIGR03086 family protein, partial [Chloroflexota bacterium]